MVVPYGETTQRILKLLEDGPMTRGDICLALGLERTKSAAILSRLNRASHKYPKRVYVIDWTYRDDTNSRYYARALYALGDLPNKKKPKPDHKAAAQRYRERNKKRVASVFELGLDKHTKQQKAKELRACMVNALKPVPAKGCAGEGIALKMAEQ